MKHLRLFNLIIGLLLLAALKSFSQDNSECLACHNDPDLKTDRNGKPFSLFVSEDKFGKFSHKNQKCVNCHQGFKPDEMPHKANITPVNCKNCHKEPQKIHPFHPNMAKANGTGGSKDINCKGCHSYHYPETRKDPKAKFYFKNLANGCGECHTREKNDFMGSAHYPASMNNENSSPTCFNCHKNPITPGFGLDKPALKDNQRKLCLTCHTGNGQNLASHVVDLSKSIHGSAFIQNNKDAPVCMDCHGIHNVKNGKAPDATTNQFNLSRICSKCHISVSAEFQSSVHGLALSQKNPDAPSCKYCHLEHNPMRKIDIAPSIFTQNDTLRAGIVANKMVYCISCHTNKELSARNGLKTVDESHTWLTQNDKHLLMVKCTDCHSANTHQDITHDILPPDRSVKDCDYCHSNNSKLFSVLTGEKKRKAIEKNGLINGMFSGEGYVRGISRNLLIEGTSWVLFILIALAFVTHWVLRLYFNRNIKHKEDNKGKEI